MANTYTKIYIHIVFAVKNRINSIPPTFIQRLYAYINGTLNKMGHYPIAIGGTENHIHILIDYNVNQKISDLVRDLKTMSSRFINDEAILRGKFEWQTGYACFSYSHSHVDAVKNYINRQFEHHKNTTLEDEIRSMLDKFGVKYDEKYILKELPD